MARETRRQRRDARREAGEQDGSAGRAARRGADPAASTTGGFGQSSAGSGTLAAPALTHPTGRRRFQFFREVIGELRKVEWPNRAQVVQGTVVVIVACAIVGSFLYVADLVLKPFVQHVLLGQ